MQLESERTKVPLTTAGPGQSHAGNQGNSILTAQKTTDWLIIYSFFICLNNFCTNLSSRNDYVS